MNGNLIQRNIMKIGVILITVMLYTSPIPTSGIYTESFDQDTLPDDWIYYAITADFEKYVDSTWEVQNGVLGSFGGFNDTVFQYACHATNSSMGPWKFDVQQPENPSAFGFWIATFPAEVSSSRGNGYEIEPVFIQFSFGNQGMKIRQSYKIGGQVILSAIDMSKDELKGLWHFTIERDDTKMWVMANGTKVIEATLLVDQIVEYDSFGVWSQPGSNVTIDNIIVGSESSGTSTGGPADLPWAGILAGVTVFTAISFVGGRSYIKKKRARRVQHHKIVNKQIIKNFSQEFNLSNYGLASLVTGVYRVDVRYKDEDFQKMVPQELIKYRYLMHPTRLSIMKLLNHQTKMRSTEIRHILNISWGDFSTHTKSLEEKGFVELIDEFNEDGHVVQTVYIKPEGAAEYQELLALLEQFVSYTSPVNDILGEADDFSKDNLYPK